ncbi:MAG TPA: polymer-forming cytoskeletal protein [Acidobacteriota bacterium]|nr:polymer-forming cytoskeletal protein [Acidobacteriota bacterium]
MNAEPKITRLAEGTVVKGEISFPGGKLRVEGELHGNVTSAESVEVVQKGKIHGDVLDTAEIELQGKIEGNIKTKKLIIRPTGVLTGNLDVEHFVMEEGGKILGEVKMNLGEPRETWKPASPRAQTQPVEIGTTATKV